MSIDGMSIILDKSTLQGLSLIELQEMNRYYHVVVPPILIIEILGDLYSPPAIRDLTPEQNVQTLARKLLAVRPSIHIDYRYLRNASLLGNEILTSFQPVIDEDNNASTLLNMEDWQRGNFSQVDRADAATWKETSAQNLENFQKGLLQIQRLAGLTSLSAIFESMNSVFKSDFQQSLYVEWFCNRIQISPETRFLVCRRWELVREPFYIFAPYAYYCFLIEQVFHQGLAAGLVKTATKAKSYVDLQYAYYLPYARIFSSSDLGHQQIWDAFASSEQQLFVNGGALKADLKAILEHIQNCPELELNNLRQCAPRPPELLGSLTKMAYQKLVQLSV